MATILGYLQILNNLCSRFCLTQLKGRDLPVSPIISTCCLIALTALSVDAACLGTSAKFIGPGSVMKTFLCIPLHFVAFAPQLFIWMSSYFGVSQVFFCILSPLNLIHMISQKATDLFFHRWCRWCYSHQHCVRTDGTESRQHTLASSWSRTEDHIWWHVR